MKLSEKQFIFTFNVHKLIEYVYQQGFKASLGECERTPEQAAIYAKQGIGIKDSLHCKRLAIDLNLFDSNGNYLTDKASYEPFGRYWESLHPLNRFGGNFKRVDLDHFEMQDL
jgi:hypothetical protein